MVGKSASSRFPETLIVLPCSGRKSVSVSARVGERPGATFLDYLGGSREAVEMGRVGRAPTIKHDSPLVRALDLYDGNLYRSFLFRETLSKAIAEGTVSALILSGGYGAVLPDEAIRDYDAYMDSFYWLKHQLNTAIAEYITTTGTKRVYGFLSSSYSYVFENVPWGDLGGKVVEAGVFVAVRQGIGTPSKLGEAARRFIEMGLDRDALLQKMPVLRWRPLVPQRSSVG